MLSRLFRQSSVPREYRSNFLHLYLDIGWFGILSGSSINFLAVYAARLGASAMQIGLIGAASAAVSLLIAIPSLIFWSYYTKKVEMLAVEMETLCDEFIRRQYR